MATNTHSIGAGVRLRATIADVDGEALDPSSIVVRVRKPDGSVVVFTGGQIVRESAGIYHCDTDIADLAGDYWQRWEVTGPSPVKGAEEKAFRVRASKVL